VLGGVIPNTKGHPKGWPVYVRVRGQSRRSADTRHRPGDEYCTTGTGQLLTYTDDQRTATVQHKLPFPPSNLYSHFRPTADL
jgi:hypothetical protein